MMGKGQKIVTTVLWALAVLAMLGVVGTGLWAKKRGEAQRQHADPEAILVSSQPGRARLEKLFDAPDFALTDQNGRTVTAASLRGSAWIADFIFTNCAGPCPKMTALMADLQARVQRPDVKLVSFTVDPQRDTPPILKQYAAKSNADDSRWSFLTGSVQQMHDVAAGMNIAAEKRSEDESIIHSTWFLLVDKAGQVRGIYRQSDPTDIDRLAEDAVTLADEKPAEARP
jgi:protein SCO1/2